AVDLLESGTRVAERRLPHLVGHRRALASRDQSRRLPHHLLLAPEPSPPEERAADPVACAPAVEEVDAPAELAGAAGETQDLPRLPVDDLDVTRRVATPRDDGRDRRGELPLAGGDPERRCNRREAS